MNNFDIWNKEKQNTNNITIDTVFYEREIWWAKIGINIGVEIDGKHELSLRPVVVLRKFNKDMLLVIPTTTQEKYGKYYVEVFGEDGRSYRACISQIRVISAKRLLRKISTINKSSYDGLIQETAKMVKGQL